MIPTPQKKYNKFKYYLRQCDGCDELFHAPSRKCRLCPKCKKISNTNKIMKSLKSRGIKLKVEIQVTEVKNGCI